MIKIGGFSLLILTNLINIGQFVHPVGGDRMVQNGVDGQNRYFSQMVVLLY